MAYPEDFDDLFVSSKSEFLGLTPGAQTAYCLHRLEAQVNNGGLYQFFSNQTGEYVRETMQALNDIGAPRTANLLSQAVTICFPHGYPENAGNFEDAVADYDSVADALAPLEQEFYQYVEPLSDLVNQHLAKSA